MRFPRQTKVFRGPVDAAPFAAVFFCLVLLLMLNTSLVFPPGIPIQLPQTGDLPGLQTPHTVVAIDEQGRLYFENQMLEPAAFQARLRQRVKLNEDQPLTLLIQADRSLELEDLTEVILLAKEAGVEAAFLATRTRPDLGQNALRP